MCGFVGFYKQGEPKALSKQLELCLSTIRHRGKDHQQTLALPPFYSAHSRLKIIDLDDRSNQPYYFGQKYIVLFNGEIYNYLHLKDQLAELGHSFHTSGDTEVIATGYLEWGTGLFEKLDGMFAIAIYDIRAGQIVLARDIFGKKPLYYSTRDGFSFCSELDAFKILYPNIQLSETAVNQFLSIGYTLHPTTIYEDVYLLPPSNYLVYDVHQRQKKITEYYQIEKFFYPKIQDSFRNITQKAFSLLKNAVQKRFVGDVNGGIFLSAGMDSCGIAAISRNIFGYRPPCYTISYADTGYDEYDVAEKLTRQLGLRHSKIDLSDIDTEDFNQYLKKQDYLTFDNSSYSIYKLAEMASKEVGYVLTGDGGDEMFGGYSTYQADQINLKLKTIIPILKHSGLLSAVDKLTQNRNDRVGFFTKINRLSRGLDTDYRKAHYQWRQIFNPEQRIAIMGEKYRDFIYDTDPYVQFQKLYRKAENLEIKDQHLFVDMKTWLSDNNLIKLDRNTMAHSLEARSPFLDRELFEYVAGCPIVYKNGKIILKKILKPLLPDYILNRKKTGFNSPVYRWFGVKENEFEFYTRYIYDRIYKIR